MKKPVEELQPVCTCLHKDCPIHGHTVRASAKRMVKKHRKSLEKLAALADREPPHP